MDTNVVNPPTCRATEVPFILGAVATGIAACVGVAWSTRPLHITFAIFFLDPTSAVGFFVLAFCLGMTVFLLIGFPLLLRQPLGVLFTAAFHPVLSLWSIFHFAYFWSGGLQHQGATYTITLAVINGVMALLTFGLGNWAVFSRRYWVRFAFTLTLCLWFVWPALPWLGEWI